MPKTKKKTKPMSDARLTNPVQVNFTDDQKEQVVAAAGGAGMALATFIRVAALDASQLRVRK